MKLSHTLKHSKEPTRKQMSNVFARFAVESGKITRPKNQPVRIHPKLFEFNDKLDLSVSRIEGLSCKEMKEEGVRVTKERGKKSLHGWAEITKELLQCLGLEVFDKPPPPLHSIIKGPSERDDQLMIQKKLAQKAKPVLLEEKIAV